MTATVALGIAGMFAMQISPAAAAENPKPIARSYLVVSSGPDTDLQGQQSSGAIVPGFNSETFGPNDDGSYPCTGSNAGVPSGCTPTPITLPFPVNFYGNVYSSLYLNNNGNLSFGQPVSEYTPQSLNQIDVPMIAPFWADVDTRTGPVVTFGYGTVNGHAAFGVNWLNVGCYSENDSVTDSFQVLLIDRSDLGYGDWQIEFNYGPINWDSGQASGGNGQCLGGTAARAGYTSGLGPACELPGSGVDGGLLSSNAATGLSSHDFDASVPGRFVFDVGGLGQPSGCSGYVALGDSYSSGVGTGDYDYAGSPCYRSSYAWPALLADDYAAAPPLGQSSFFACSGDTTTDLLNGKSGEPVSQVTQLANWASSNGDPSLVTLTLGGDDLQFANVVKTCVLHLPHACESTLQDEVNYLLNGGFQSSLQKALQKVVSAAGSSSQVVLVGYPYLFPSPTFGNSAEADLLCPWMKLDASSILRDFQNAQELLDAVQAQVAGSAGVRFIELGDLFAGDEMCTSEPYYTGIISGVASRVLTGELDAFHPNLLGQLDMANYVAAQLGYLAGNGNSAQASRPARTKPAATKPSATKPSATKPSAKPEVSRASGHSVRSAAAGSASARRNPQAGVTSLRPAARNRAASSTPVINAGLSDGEMSTPYAGFLWATGGTAPYTWSVTSGSLPAGLTLDSSSGIVSGTPTGTGTSDFTVTATDSSSPALTATASESIAVDAIPALAIQTTALPDPTVGQQYQATLEATGGDAPYTWSVSSGTLPGGLSLDPSTGDLTGTPTASGPSTFTIAATDSSSSSGTTVTATFTVNVASATSTLAATSPQLPSGTQGTGYAGTLTSTGGTGPVYWSIESGNLPDGLSLDPGTGQISGIATGAGTYSFTAQVIDSSSPTPQSATESLSITIAAASAPAVLTSSLADGAVNQPYTGAVVGNGGVAPYTWSVGSGALPDGLSLDPSSGMITGTPTASGTFTFDVSLADSSTPAAQTASAALSITIAPPPSPPAMTVTDTVTDGLVGNPYNATVIPVGGVSPYSYSVESGNLPDGLTLDPQAGTITGTPTTTGSFSATIEVTDSSSPTPEIATDDVTINITNPPALGVTTSSLPDANVGAAYAQPIGVTGGTGADTFAVTAGALPGGLALDPSSGIIYGAPTSTGTSSFTVTATDSATPTPDTASASLTLTTDAAESLNIVTASLPDASQGVGYSQVLAASGGTAPYTWSVSSGALPAGLSLDPTTGLISGTPSGSGTSTFTVEATDSSSPSAEDATTNFTLRVDAAPAVTIATAGLDPATQGDEYSDSLAAAGGTGAITWSVTAGSLPAGLTLDPGAGVISGTPTGSGTSYFTVEATDSSTPTPQTATAQLSIEVVPEPPAFTPQSISFTAPATGVAGGSATLSATGGASGNPVVFTVDPSSGSGVCAVSGTNGTTVTYAAAGNCVIDANQAGNASYSPAPQVQQTITVSKASTTTRLAVTGSPAAYGHEQAVTFSATVSPQVAGSPSGTVTVRAGSATLCTGTLAHGAATCKPGSATILAPGTYRAVATYSGSSGFVTSTSSPVTLTVTKAPTVSTLSLSARSVRSGKEKTLVATVKVAPKYAGTPGGTITIMAGKTLLCRAKLSKGRAKCSPSSGRTLRVGTYKVIAIYSGNADFAGSKSIAFTLRIVN
jgi:GDSL-like Lipase/Acylhydrolase family/Bacterial Ig-like domain (group 3)/Putative Ig domain